MGVNVIAHRESNNILPLACAVAKQHLLSRNHPHGLAVLIGEEIMKPCGDWSIDHPGQDDDEGEQWGMPHPDWPGNWEDLTTEQLRILERSGSYGQRLTAIRYLDEAKRKGRA